MIDCVMLIDDSENDIFIHSRAIKKSKMVHHILTMGNGELALNYLTTMHAKGAQVPEIIFLDLNMPKMNGWDFLVEYNKLPKESKAKKLIVILSSEEDPKGPDKAKKAHVDEFRKKPLTEEMFREIIANIK